MTLSELIEKYKVIPGSPLEADLYALLYTESERAAAMVDAQATWAAMSDDGDTMFHLRNARDEILRTSPGKGGA